MLQPKDIDWLNGYKNKTHVYVLYKRPTSDLGTCLLYTSDAADESEGVDLGGRRIIKKNGNKNIHIDNYVKCKWIKCSNQKT